MRSVFYITILLCLPFTVQAGDKINDILNQHYDWNAPYAAGAKAIARDMRQAKLETCKRGDTYALAAKLNYHADSAKEALEYVGAFAEKMKVILTPMQDKTDKNLLSLGQKSRNYFNYAIKPWSQGKNYKVGGAYILIFTGRENTALAQELYDQMKAAGIDMRLNKHVYNTSNCKADAELPDTIIHLPPEN